MTVDGETHTNVGVRKKGFLSSRSDTKPSLKLRFNKYVVGQTLGGVMNRMTLNNNQRDRYMINTCMTYRVFAAAGNPTPRCNFAAVTVNGRYLGLYSHVEPIKTPFLSRHFENVGGNLYEGAVVGDFTPDYRDLIEKKTNENADDWSDIDTVVAALQDPSDAGLEALGGDRRPGSVPHVLGDRSDNRALGWLYGKQEQLSLLTGNPTVSSCSYRGAQTTPSSEKTTAVNRLRHRRC